MTTDTISPASLLGLTNANQEITVLAAMRADMPLAIELAQLLIAADFYEIRRQVVFQSIQNLLLGVDTVDTPAIVAECRSVIRDRKLKVTIDADYVDSLDAGDIRRARSYANSIKRLSWLRGAGDFAYWLVEELQTRPDPETLFAAAQERWQTLQPKTADSKFVYGWDTIALHDEIMRQREQARADGIVSRFDWPWGSWNEYIRPLQPGFVGILAAPDGMGKTTYLEQIAEHWARVGFNVVYVHLEDSLEYKLDRRRARVSRVSISRIQDATLTDEDRAKLKAGDEKLDLWAGTLHYYHAAGESMTAIVRELETRVSEGTCQAVVFDYLDKVQPSRVQATLYGSNPWERQANDMEQLKVFAEKARIPVFTATQGNKSMQSGGQQTRQAIQGSGQKSQKAQLVIIVTRDIVGEQGLRDGSGRELAKAGEYSPVVKLRIDKSNIGRTGDLQQYLLGEYFTIADMRTERKEI